MNHVDFVSHVLVFLEYLFVLFIGLFNICVLFFDVIILFSEFGLQLFRSEFIDGWLLGVLSIIQHDDLINMKND